MKWNFDSLSLFTLNIYWPIHALDNTKHNHHTKPIELSLEDCSFVYNKKGRQPTIPRNYNFTNHSKIQFFGTSNLNRTLANTNIILHLSTKRTEDFQAFYLVIFDLDFNGFFTFLYRFFSNFFEDLWYTKLFYENKVSLAASQVTSCHPTILTNIFCNFLSCFLC
jgi:hypothetical protein